SPTLPKICRGRAAEQTPPAASGQTYREVRRSPPEDPYLSTRGAPRRALPIHGLDVSSHILHQEKLSQCIQDRRRRCLPRTDPASVQAQSVAAARRFWVQARKR